jgi:lysozyme
VLAARLDITIRILPMNGIEAKAARSSVKAALLHRDMWYSSQMLTRRLALGGAVAASLPALTACGSKQAASPAPAQTYVTGTPSEGARPSVPGLDAVIDISHNVTVSDFNAVRRGGILACIHKATEGGDFVDRSYQSRRVQAERAGLLWGAYHFGTRQYPGAQQANHFLDVVRPGPSTLISLDLEANDGNPNNTMRLSQAEQFVQTIQQRTGRLPLLYTHPKWADGHSMGRRRMALERPITPDSILARCDLWVADYRQEPEIPSAWAIKGWRLWQYVANEDESHAAFGSVPRAIPGISHCDRNLFNGDEAALRRFWRV